MDRPRRQLRARPAIQLHPPGRPRRAGRLAGGKAWTLEVAPLSRLEREHRPAEPRPELRRAASWRYHFSRSHGALAARISASRPSMLPPETTHTIRPARRGRTAPPRPARRAGAFGDDARASGEQADRRRRSRRATTTSEPARSASASGHISASTPRAADAVHEARRVVDRRPGAPAASDAANGAAVSTSHANTFAPRAAAPQTPRRCRTRGRRRRTARAPCRRRAGPRGSRARSSRCRR